MKKWLDILTVMIAVATFLLMALGLVVPWRRPDTLTLALCGLLTTLALVFALSLLQLFGWLPPLLPAWEGWTVRIAFDAFGVAGIYQMFRAGVLRRKKE
jgi:hypothetical protein